MNQTDEQAYCSVSVPGPGGWFRSTCSRKAKLERGGKPYCTQHDPEHVAAKRTAQRARSKAEGDARKVIYRRRAAEKHACEGIPTEALEAGVVADLLAACEAALRYDESILGQAARGNVDLLNTGLGVAEGEDLDSLYEDWMSKAHAAIAKTKGVSP